MPVLEILSYFVINAVTSARRSVILSMFTLLLLRAQMPAVTELVSLMRDDNKCPDGTILLPWARGKPMARDVTVPDTYARVPHRQHSNQARCSSPKDSTEQD